MNKLNSVVNPLVKKLIFMIILGVILQIVLFIISGIINDRKYLYNDTVRNIGNEWGGNQKIIAPVFVASFPNSADKTYILPDELNISINLEDEIRTRGIYKATVYKTNAKISGYFLSENLPNKEMVAFLSVGLSDTKSILKINKFTLGNKNENLDLMSGANAEPLFYAGFSGLITKEYAEALEMKKIPFEIDIDFRGSRDISILPLGKNNNFIVKSNWKSPSFSGILPINRKISDNGFSAEWNMTNLVRNYPQIINIKIDKNSGKTLVGNYDDFIQSSNDYRYDNYYNNTYDEVGNFAKVQLFDPVTNYTQVNRAIKYGILFIMLTMMITYIFEIISKKYTHYIQYGVVGFSLTVFYLLLLSLSEHINFPVAYLIASIAIVIPNSLYIMSLTESKKIAFGMFSFLSIVYLILFSILRMEQYALLTGTALILIILYLIMYLTRKNTIFQVE